jgi:predicted Zn-dependent peptidase
MVNNYKKTTLKNGLRIITVPVKGTKTVSVLVLVGTGSKYETKEINGLSHFLEHMLFKGTKKRPNTLKLIEPLDKIGGHYNAFTGQEYTGYWAKVDANHLDLVLDWVADIYLNSKLEQAEINREKGTILQELNMYLDTPSEYIDWLWTNILYGDQPAGWSVIGTKEVIKKVKREQFVKYLEGHYSAQNTLVILAGQLSHSSALNRVKRYFQKINTFKPREKLPVKERQRKPAALVYYKKTDQSHLCLGVRAYDIFHPDKYALGLLGTILGGNMSSRLFIKIRERLGLAYQISTGASSDTDAGFLLTKAGADNDKIEKVIKITLGEYRKIACQKVSPAELRKAKDYIKGSSLISMESSDAQASFFGTQELLTNEILTLEEKFAKIETVTVNDIQRVAQDIFQPAKLNLSLIGPFKDKRRFEKILTL